MKKDTPKRSMNIFVAGTDTGVGKTVITGLLGRYLSENGINTVTQKWVQTGSGRFPADIASHLKLMGKKQKDYAPFVSDMAPYVFSFPGSPHLSASLEKRMINVSKISSSFERLRSGFEAVIVEGAGGTMVPLSENKLIVDVCAQLKIPVLLVVGNKLGAINHSLLAVEAIHRRSLLLLGLVFDQVSWNEDALILEDNPGIVSKLTGERVFGALSYNTDPELLYKNFSPVGENILNALKELENPCA